MIAGTLQRFFEAHSIPGPLLVAVSGGADSTALLVALAESETIELHAAHVNHHLRGAESDADQGFVQELCNRHNVPLQVLDGSLDPAALRTGGVEMAARQVRYESLQRMRLQTGASHIVTAHQKNDQAETVLMRLMTGGGIAALRGIHPLRDDGVIRPMLEVRRSEIEAFLRDRGITPRLDRSNADPRFLRNRIRALLAQFDPSVIDNLAAVAEQARQQHLVLEQFLDRIDTSVGTPLETRFTSLPDDPWLRQALLHRHIHRLDPGSRDVSAADLQRLARQTDCKRISVTRSLELIRSGSLLILRKRPQPTAEFEIPLRPGDATYIPQLGVTVRLDNGDRRPATGDRQSFQLPPGANGTFLLRNRRRGDRFQPLGMSQQKKLKDFLIDRKIPAEVRDRIPLLVWNGTIVWVGGVEISEAFKITIPAGELYEVSIEEEAQEGLQREGDRQTDR